MTRPLQQLLTEDSARESAADQALAVIREQYLHLDADEQRIFRRILRQVARLDAALADLHLFLPVIEICFYGVGSGNTTGHSLSLRSLRRLIKRWDAENRGRASQHKKTNATRGGNASSP